ncbi:phosphomannomutase/phosphoglucomutase [Acinetobacter sp. 230853]|uniref:phosphomannomutase/phosphoglucomutase n=1 Tax=Acinetobacter sp. 230853 TaxID=1310651 RepID=UPI00044C7500|nr:phosphomannomutase/phosphoglucomutase [Acinetobacter sp. 230853]EXB69844.1 phosphoglucomutase/phosphomannomutase, C-terminal domain protein [Acinetobacter sp. 230853]
MELNHSPFPKAIFRAYDIRGKLACFTPAVVRATAHALAKQFKEAGQSELVIGYDARLSSPFYAQILTQVCGEEGLSVTEIGCCSSPQMYYLARNYSGNGIMVTASHNPKTDNGIKWIIQGEPPCPDMIQTIASTAENYYQPPIFDSILTLPHQHKAEFCSLYQQAILKDIHLKQPLKVVLDALNGSAGECAETILKKLGCEVIALRCKPDGNFPDHAPDPSQAVHLKQLQANMIEQQAHIGIALDGDGDRVVLVDEQANIITADRLLSLFSQMCLENHPGHAVVFDVKCSSMVRNTVRNLGGHPHMIRTGSSFLRKYLSQSGGYAVFGGEYAGHYVFNDGRGFGYDDGLYAALRVIEYMGHFPDKKLSELLAVYPERCCTEDTYISTHQTNPKTVLEDIEILSHRFGAQLSKIDGIRLDFKDGFGIIRASNTGEYFTVRFDADDRLTLNKIRYKFVSMLSERYPEIAQDILDAQ